MQVLPGSSSIEYTSLMDDETKAQAIEDGEIEIELGWRTITHSKEFVESLDNVV